MPLLTLLKSDLPNFPEEVLNEWLLPYAESEGWPPAPDAATAPQGRWRFLMRNQPLRDWRAIRWFKVERHLPFDQLHPQYQDILLQMAAGAVAGERNAYSEFIEDLGERFQSVVAYLREHAVLPCPPALLAEPGGFTVLDGSHRMAAYFYCRGDLASDLGSVPAFEVRDLQAYWIGELPQGGTPDR